MDEFRDTATEFYRELNAGRKDAKDFEKYVYGQYGSKGFHKDEQRIAEDKAYLEQKKIENEVKAYVASQSSRKV